MTGQVALRGLDPLDGFVLRPDHADYDAARQSFNGMLDRRPEAIVRCRSVQDVVAAVRAARDAGLPIAVRGGGHGIAGHAMADGSVVVDLREMRSVSVDPARRVARAQGGAQWEDVDRATTAHGLATTGGTFWDTGIGGLTLTGGIGFLMGTAGLTCDNLVGATVVTATGDVVVAGADGDPELLWGLRGGGGNFGVVTEFVYALHPIGEFQDGAIQIPLESARAGLAAVADLARTAPPELVIFVLGPGHPLTLPQPVDPGTPRSVMRIAIVFQGSTDEARAVVAPLSALPGATTVITPATYVDIQSSSELMPFGMRHYWKGHFVRELDGPAIEATARAMETAPGSSSFVLAEAITGQARTEPAGGAAFGQREARWNISAIAVWEAPAEDDAQVAWARTTADALEASSLSGAGYGNYQPVDETADRVRASYGPERYERLVRLKDRYDPGNVFRFNRNVPPSG